MRGGTSLGKLPKDTDVADLTLLPFTFHHLAILRKLQVAGQRDSATCGDAILTFGLLTGPSR